MILPLAAELDTIRDREQDGLNARVLGQLVIQSINRPPRGLLHRAGPESSGLQRHPLTVPSACGRRAKAMPEKASLVTGWPSTAP